MIDINTSKKNIVIVLHPSPDADNLAAAYVLIELLKQKDPKKKFHILSNTTFKIPFPKQLLIPEFENQITFQHIPEDSCAFVIDHSSEECSALKNGRHQNISELFIVDHHIYYGGAPRGTKLLINENAGSTCEVLYDYLKAKEFEGMTEHIATAIYIGMFADGMHGTKPIKAKQFRAVVDLMDNHGAKIEQNDLFFKGKYLLYEKMLAATIFMCSSKSTRCDVVTLNIRNDGLTQRLIPNFISIYEIQTRLLNCRGVSYVLGKVERKPNLFSVSISGRPKKSINTLTDDKIYRHDYHIWPLLGENQARRVLKNLRDRIARAEAKKETVSMLTLKELGNSSIEEANKEEEK